MLRSSSRQIGFPMDRQRRGGLVFAREGRVRMGASGPTIDTKNTQTASLVHDALWQLIAAGKLSKDLRDASNDEFHAILIDKGVRSGRERVIKFAVAKSGTSG